MCVITVKISNNTISVELEQYQFNNTIIDNILPGINDSLDKTIITYIGIGVIALVIFAIIVCVFNRLCTARKKGSQIPLNNLINESRNDGIYSNLSVF